MRLRLLLALLCAALLGTPTGCGPGESNGGDAPAADASPAEASATAETPADEPVVRVKKFLSKSFHVDRKWGSMQGPSQVEQLVLEEPDRPEVLWITGYRAAVVPGDGEGSVSQEFMCHNNLDFRGRSHAEIFGWSRSHMARNRMFTVSQGQFDLALPEGFALPVRSDEPLNLTTQVLNHNVENPELDIRHEIEITYSRDVDLEQPPAPLLQHAIFVMASLEDGEAYYGVADPSVEQEGSSCSVGEHAQGMANEAIFSDELGRKFTGHWVVKPGRETRHTLVTKQLALTEDTRVHFIAVHVHPFAETLELRDLTTGESVWTAHASGPAEGVGLTTVDTYSSEEGLQLYKDHEYELVSVYDNDSGVDQDAMATMFLYMYDAEGDKGIESLRRKRAWASEAL